ncbi:MAG: GNAT family N-acetyltransferase [Negativicutes bacterium]|nr:GNAT family N-acetyltransferase [Negativicutes bacterium]
MEGKQADEGQLELAVVAEEDVEAVVAMVTGVFDRFIAPGLASEGIREFYRFIRPEAMRVRMAGGGEQLVVRRGKDLAGMIEVREGSHISLLFIAADFQRQGVARRLLAAAEERLRQRRPEAVRMTVNAAPAAVGVYEKLGFEAVCPLQEKFGIRFIPMAKLL